MSEYVSLALSALSDALSFVVDTLNSFDFFGVSLLYILIGFTALAVVLSLLLRPVIGSSIRAGSSDVVGYTKNGKILRDGGFPDWVAHYKDGRNIGR